MIIIIGNAAPNTLDDVKVKREQAAKNQGNLQYWATTKYPEPTYWERELLQIREAEVPVHCI